MGWTYTGNDEDTSAEFHSGVIDVSVEMDGGTFCVWSEALALNGVDAKTDDLDEAKTAALSLVEGALRRALDDVAKAKGSP